MSKAGLRRLAFLKLIEQSRKLSPLILRQKGKDPFLRRVLPYFLGFQSLRIIGIGVPGIDLHDIVDETHEHDLPDIHGRIGVLPQKPGHDRHVPGMLRVVFPPPVAGEVRLPEHVFLLIDLQGKGQLLLQPLVSFFPIHRYLSFLLAAGAGNPAAGTGQVPFPLSGDPGSD